jgi:diguanylate cyclase (GGDEF)-like protein
VKRVTLAGLHLVEASRPPGAGRDDQPRDASAAEVLQSQRWARARIALLVALVQGALVVLAHGEMRRLPLLAATALGYALLVHGLATLARRRAEAPPALVTAVLAADIAFVFIVTALGTTPDHYERALLGGVIVVHAANFYFGRRQAWRAMAMGLVAFLTVLGLALLRHGRVNLVEESWSLAVAIAGTTLVVAQAGDVRRRLRMIVELFERAEKGDFTRSYDEELDARPDAITRVGRAYNRVREQLANMVLSDPLTGCLNRRGFEQAYAREVARSTRAGSDLALLVLDLDHFKMVNDTYGHPAGDEVLRGAGRLLADACRAGDIVARVGGEEFALLLPDTGATGSFHFATRLCEVVRLHPFPSFTPDAPPIHVTTSIGVASRIPHRGIDDGAAGLTARADTALYAAKRAGRDRVRVWSQELEERMPGTIEAVSGLAEE